eukprot:TRINITY_DN77748_c0_g1_i1.p2 TRINITY_DN77748_c0_g1~~TRINITY_DN77748_c0_g1_i1.p2  ORF type:complete len:107 (-),score=12.91 TRINITY_DN77748_c0_g1_i1:48-368(-)
MKVAQLPRSLLRRAPSRAQGEGLASAGAASTGENECRRRLLCLRGDFSVQPGSLRLHSSMASEPNTELADLRHLRLARRFLQIYGICNAGAMMVLWNDLGAKRVDV